MKRYCDYLILCILYMVCLIGVEAMAPSADLLAQEAPTRSLPDPRAVSDQSGVSADKPTAPEAAVEQQRGLDALITQLAARSYAQREAAMYELFERHDIPLAQIMERLVGRSVSSDSSKPEDVEMGERLMKVAVHRYFLEKKTFARQAGRKEQGALGVLCQSFVFEPNDKRQEYTVRPSTQVGTDTPGVIVTQICPGFVAYSRLRVGDVIIGLDGQPFGRHAYDEFLDVLKTYLADDAIRVALVRDGQLMEITIEMGSRARLITMSLSLGRDNVIGLMNHELFQTYLKSFKGKQPSVSPIQIKSAEAKVGKTKGDGAKTKRKRKRQRK